MVCRLFNMKRSREESEFLRPYPNTLLWSSKLSKMETYFICSWELAKCTNALAIKPSFIFSRSSMKLAVISGLSKKESTMIWNLTISWYQIAWLSCFYAISVTLLSTALSYKHLLGLPNTEHQRLTCRQDLSLLLKQRFSPLGQFCSHWCSKTTHSLKWTLLKTHKLGTNLFTKCLWEENTSNSSVLW
jgi:hypothetical protein